MSQVLPNQIHGLPGASSAICRIFTEFKKLSHPEIIIRFGISEPGTVLPHFLITYQESFAALVCITSVDKKNFDDSAADWIDSSTGLSRETVILKRFSQELRDELGDRNSAIPNWILAPRLDDRFEASARSIIEDPGIEFYGKSTCRAHAIQSLILQNTTNRLDSSAMATLRSKFDPDSVIRLVKSSDRKPKVAAELATATQIEFFLDLAQETQVKRDLDLSPEGRPVVANGAIRLITGGAGCGKTIILLHRAKLLAKVNRNARILGLTHNRALSNELQERFQDLAGDKRVHWRTFFQWISGVYGGRGPKVISEGERIELLRRIAQRNQREPRFEYEELGGEFEWITDQEIDSVTQYIEINRTGRSRPLHARKREEIYESYLEYRSQLEQKNVEDWAGFGRRFLQDLREKRLRIQPFDAVLVDEAQFFAPTALRAIMMVSKPSATITLATDPTQGFLKRRGSWKSAGIDARGRTVRLRRPYRCSKQILEFASLFYQLTSKIQDEEDNLPSREALENSPDGPAPLILRVPSKNALIPFASELLVNQLENKGLSPDHLLAIGPDKRSGNDLINAINLRADSDIAVEARAKQREGKLRVGTFKSVTGLESHGVLLFGLESVLEQSKAERLSDEAAEEANDRARQTLYVAMTRARNGLVILVHSDDLENRLRNALDESQ